MSVVESSTQSMLGVHGWIHLIMVIATALLLKKYVEIHGFHMTTETSKIFSSLPTFSLYVVDSSRKICLHVHIFNIF